MGPPSKVDELPLLIQRSLFRIVQEPLAKVHRHASATHVFIELRCTVDRLHLIITDNGHGMRGGQAGAPLREGVGIYGI